MRSAQLRLLHPSLRRSPIALTSHGTGTASYEAPACQRNTPQHYQFRSLSSTKQLRLAPSAAMSSLSPLHSHACCTVPPVSGGEYKAKGKYITVNGQQTYATGPDDAKKGILVIMDLFGFYPQTLQGSDILAYGDKEQPYKVFIPDPFDGEPADISWYPPDNDEKGQKLGNFFKTKAAPPKTIERIPKILEELKQGEAKGIETWGILGYCWGGKVAQLASIETKLFKAVASCHPAMVDAEDAKKVNIPLAMLASKDEDKDDVEKFKQALKGKYLIETFSDQIHGWMAARSDLSDPRVREEYERGYKVLLDFFHENI